MKTVSIVPKDKPSQQPVPAGLHPFVLYAVYDVGTVPSKGGFDAKRKVVFAFELPEQPPLEFKEDDGSVTRKARAVSKTFGLSFHQKATLRIQLEAWRGKPFTDDEAKNFQLEKLIGANGQLQIMHTSKDGKTYANVHALLPAAKGQKYKPTIPTTVFSVEALEQPDELGSCLVPDWIKKMVESSEEYEELKRGGPRQQSVAQAEEAVEEADDSVPF